MWMLFHRERKRDRETEEKKYREGERNLLWRLLLTCVSFHLERETEREKKIQRGREKAVVKAIGFVGVVPSREREREREREKETETERGTERTSEREREISIGKNKEYKKEIIFYLDVLKNNPQKDKQSKNEVRRKKLVYTRICTMHVQ